MPQSKDAGSTSRLAAVSADLNRLLIRNRLPLPQFSVSDIDCRAVLVRMRDGIQLATDLYLPPVKRAPVIVVRTPYGRSLEDNSLSAALWAFARRGYAVVSQDCRGTGDSEPDAWDYYVYEAEDSYDCIEWITQQEWCDGFIGACGSS